MNNGYLILMWLSWGQKCHEAWCSTVSHVLGNGPPDRQQLDLEGICLIKEHLLWKSKMQDYKYKKRTKTFLRGLRDLWCPAWHPSTPDITKGFLSIGPLDWTSSCFQIMPALGACGADGECVKADPSVKQGFIKITFVGKWRKGSSPGSFLHDEFGRTQADITVWNSA